MEKENYIQIIKTHLENIFGRESPVEKKMVCCSFFSSLYGEENTPKRCLLDEVKNLKGERYFTPEDAKNICLYRDMRFRTKCKYVGNPNQDNESDFDRLKQENHLLKEELQKRRTELNETLEELNKLRKD